MATPSSTSVVENETTRSKIYLKWANHFLKRRKRKLKSLSSLADGILLADLIEIVSQTSLPLRKADKEKESTLSNIKISLTFLRSKAPLNLTEQDIYNEKSTPAGGPYIKELIWSIILIYHFGMPGTTLKKLREEFNYWLSSHSLLIDDMINDIMNGGLICRLVDAIQPNSENFPKGQSVTLTRAIKTAGRKLNIPTDIFCPEDFDGGKVDEQTTLIYLAYFKRHFPAEAKTPSTKDPLKRLPSRLTQESSSVSSPRGSSLSMSGTTPQKRVTKDDENVPPTTDLEVRAKRAQSSEAPGRRVGKLPELKLKDMQNSSDKVLTSIENKTPRNEGGRPHTARESLSGGKSSSTDKLRRKRSTSDRKSPSVSRSQSGRLDSVVLKKVELLEGIFLEKPDPKLLAAGKPISLRVIASGKLAGPIGLEAAVYDSRKNSIPSSLKEVEGGYLLEVVPAVPEVLRVEVKTDGKHISGSPMLINISVAATTGTASAAGATGATGAAGITAAGVVGGGASATGASNFPDDVMATELLPSSRPSLTKEDVGEAHSPPMRREDSHRSLPRQLPSVSSLSSVISLQSSEEEAPPMTFLDSTLRSNSLSSNTRKARRSSSFNAIFSSGLLTKKSPPAAPEPLTKDSRSEKTLTRRISARMIKCEQPNTGVTYAKPVPAQPRTTNGGRLNRSLSSGGSRSSIAPPLPMNPIPIPAHPPEFDYVTYPGTWLMDSIPLHIPSLPLNPMGTPRHHLPAQEQWGSPRSLVQDCLSPHSLPPFSQDQWNSPRQMASIMSTIMLNDDCVETLSNRPSLNRTPAQSRPPPPNRPLTRAPTHEPRSPSFIQSIAQALLTKDPQTPTSISIPISRSPYTPTTMKPHSPSVSSPSSSLPRSGDELEIDLGLLDQQESDIYFEKVQNLSREMLRVLTIPPNPNCTCNDLQEFMDRLSGGVRNFIQLLREDYLNLLSKPVSERYFFALEIYKTFDSLLMVMLSNVGFLIHEPRLRTQLNNDITSLSQRGFSLMKLMGSLVQDVTTAKENLLLYSMIMDETKTLLVEIIRGLKAYRADN